MSTSIITTTTFTIATIIDVRVPVVAAAPPPAVELKVDAELDEIPLCAIVAHPRCAWTARRRCSHKVSHKS